MRPKWRRFEDNEVDKARVGLPQSLLIVDSGTVPANYLGTKTIPTWNETVKVRKIKRMVKMSINYNRNDEERKLYKPSACYGIWETS